MMKTKVIYLATKMTVAVFFVALLAIKAFAGDAPKLKLVPHSTDRAMVFVDNASEAISELTLEDINGDILYYKEGRIDEQTYSKLFDFKNLSDGDYKIGVSNVFGKKTVYFKVENNDIFIVQNEKGNEPYFSLEGDLLKLSFLNQSGKNILFTISNVSGELFRKSLGDNFSITTGFSLANLVAGDYTANLSDGKNIFRYTFEK